MPHESDQASEILTLERLIKWMDEPSFASIHDLARSLVRQWRPMDRRPIVDVYLPGDSPQKNGQPSLCSPDANDRPG